jgi:hypothetical protein
MAHLVGRESYRASLAAAADSARGEPALGDVMLHPGAPAETIPPSRRERIIDLVGIGILGLILVEVMIATYVAAGAAVILVAVVLVTGVLLMLHARPRLPHVHRAHAGHGRGREASIFPPTGREPPPDRR